MSWYLTIRSDSTYSRTADPDALVVFLRSLPELVQTGVNSFSGAVGQPWAHLTLAMSKCGSFANHDRSLLTINLVEVVCSYEHSESWYDALAGRIAAFLGWEALDEHAGRIVWPPGVAA